MLDKRENSEDKCQDGEGAADSYPDDRCWANYTDIFETNGDAVGLEVP